MKFYKCKHQLAPPQLTTVQLCYIQGSITYFGFSGSAIMTLTVPINGKISRQLQNTLSRGNLNDDIAMPIID